MKKYSLYTLLLLAVAASTVSCSDEFVDRKAPYSLDSENYFNFFFLNAFFFK